MELYYTLNDSHTHKYFLESLENAIANQLGIYYLDGEIYLPHDEKRLVFLNVTQYLYEGLYNVYLYAENESKITRMSFTTENLFKRD